MDSLLGIVLLTLIVATIIAVIYPIVLRIQRRRQSLRKSGIEVIYDSENVTFEIVAVHGLGADSTHTWEGKQVDQNGSHRVHLLRQLLHKDFPTARILNFSYNSDWLVDAPETSAQLIGMALLEDLLKQPTRAQRLPIVFVGHSFGGIVIKKALVAASEDVLQDTCGIMFLGTPHQGSSQSTAGALLASLTGIFGSNTTLLLSLQRRSRELLDLEISFRPLTQGVEIVSFYEKKPTLLFGWLSIGQVVDEWSSMSYSRKPIGMDTDHAGLNKFNSSENSEYQKLKNAIAQLRADPPFKKAVDHLRHRCYDDSALRIDRLSGAVLSMDQCYINLQIVKPVATASLTFSLAARERLERPEPDATVDLATIFEKQMRVNGVDRAAKSILIRGRAGMGKTTLCKKIVHDFNNGIIWGNLFDCILWIPLRNLKQRSGTGYNFEKLFFDEFFWSLGEENGRQFAREMCHAKGNKRVLFILDGWDEVARMSTESTDMFRFLKELLTEPNVLITSRPSAVLPPGISVDLEVETIGFSDDQIGTYIEQSQTDSSDEIMSFLWDHPVIIELARIPIQLDALCSCWHDLAASGDEARPKTMTALYTAIQTSLWKKDIERLEIQAHGVKIQTPDLQGADKDSTESHVRNLLLFLETLAFYGLVSDVIEFESARHLNKINKDYHVLLDLELPRVSFLRSSSTKTAAARSYHFIHLTFQEYFAARYFVRHWNTGPHTKNPLFDLEAKGGATPAEFLATHKYDQRYSIMWRFVAGLLDELDEEYEHGALSFFEVVEEEPRDLLGPSHQRLLLYCLHEVSLSDGLVFPAFKDNLEKRLLRWAFLEGQFLGDSSLLYQPELPVKQLGNVLKEESDKVRRVILRIIYDMAPWQIAPSADLVEIYSWLENDDESGELKSEVMRLAFSMNAHLSERALRYVLTHLRGDSEWNQEAIVILSFQPIFSPAIMSDLAAKLRYSGDSEERLNALQVLQPQTFLPREALELVTDVALTSNEPLHIRELAIGIIPNQADIPNDLLSSIQTQLECESYILQETTVQALLDSNRPDLPHDWLRFLRLQAETAQKRNSLLQPVSAQVLGNESELPNENLLSTGAEFLQTGSYNRKIQALEILQEQTDLSEEISRLIADQLVYSANNEGVETRAAQTLRNQTVLSTEILSLLRAWDWSRSVADAFEIIDGRATLSEDMVSLVVARLGDEDPCLRKLALNICRNRPDLSHQMLKLVIARLHDEDVRLRELARQILRAQSALPEETLKFVSERTDYSVPEVLAIGRDIFLKQRWLSDDILGGVAKWLKHEDPEVQKVGVSIFRLQKNPSQHVLQLLARSFAIWEPVARVSALEVLSRPGEFIWTREQIQSVVEQLEIADPPPRLQWIALGILSNQSTLSEAQLHLVVKVLATLDEHVAGAISTLRRHSPLSKELIQSCTEILVRWKERCKNLELSGSILEGDILKRVEDEWFLVKKMLELFSIQPILPDNTLDAVMELLQPFKDVKLLEGQGPAANVLTKQSHIPQKVTEMYLGLYYLGMMHLCTSKHVLWIRHNGTARLFVDSKYIPWKLPPSPEMELELIRKTQEIVVNEYFSDRTWISSELWSIYQPGGGKGGVLGRG